MLIPPKYILTPSISQLLQSIEASKAVIDSITIPLELATNIRRQSTLKSSLFSARIEGNSLTLEDLPKSPSKDQRKIEVFNILKASNWINYRKSKDITIKDILTLHQITMQSLIEKNDLGKLRTNMEAIYNKAGIAIYLPPRPSSISSLLDKMINFTNASKEPFAPIRACLIHYTFEKIHPFLDGNGRVGRLLLQMVLAKGGYYMKGLVGVEEYLDNNRTNYYQSLEEVERDTTDYLEFMLEGIAQTAQQAKDLVLEKQNVAVEDLLLPRRAEIFNIIKDHQLVNFDTFRRRFIGINERTLRYDLKKLQDQGLIKKRGTTKGAFYELTKNSATSPS